MSKGLHNPPGRIPCEPPCQMNEPSPSRRTSTYKPALAWFSAIGGLWVFVLVTLGAFTTSIGAGMIFPDWPLSDGSIDPHGWLHNIDMFAEHSHRLSAMTMGIITIILSVWLWKREERPWLRKLGWIALGLVVFQGLLGGLRVMLNGWQVNDFTMTVGQMIRIPHGIVAQLYACNLLAIAAACSRPWIEGRIPVARSLARFGIICCCLLLVQLTVAVLMRDNFAGLAIPFFPYSNIHGGFLPDAWNFRVGLNFTHRMMALVLAVALVRYAWKIHTDRGSSMVMQVGATLMVCLLAIQILLGAKVIWSHRDPLVTTGHVVCGALLLVTTFTLTWFAHRDRIESAPQA